MPDFTDEHWSVGSLSVVDEVKNTPTKKPTYVCIDKEYYKQQIELLTKYETKHQKYKLQEKIITELKSELFTLRRDLFNIIDINDELQKYMLKYKKSLNDSTVQSSHYKAELAEINNKLIELKSIIILIRDNNDNLIIENDQLQIKLNELELILIQRKNKWWRRIFKY